MVAGDSGGGSLIRQKETQTGLGHHLNIKLCLFNMHASMHGLFICYLTYCLKPLFSLASSQGKVALEIDSSS